MNISQMNRLPVELFHHLLSYFSAHEIFYTFNNVTPYIDSILSSYANYRVNFKEISQADFDLFCRHIILDQVVALTLSDNEDTRGLIDLFFSRFRIDQFSRLRALRLIDIRPDFMPTIITQMTDLKYLRSLHYFPKSSSFDSSTSKLPVNDINHVAQLVRRLFISNVPRLPRQYSRMLRDADVLQPNNFSHLRHLVLQQLTIDLIERIALIIPELKSLDSTLLVNRSDTKLMPPLLKLNRLLLRVENYFVSMSILEGMMSNLPCLRHLQLISSCDNDVVDGERWEVIAKNFLTLKFNFYIRREIIPRQIHSFQTSFWLNDKRWFVAYVDQHFFTLPRVTMTESDIGFQFPECTTALDNRILYQHIDQLMVTRYFNHLNGYFPHVQTLILKYEPPSLDVISKMIDLRKIRNLTLFELPWDFSVRHLINEMSNLSQLSIEYDLHDFLASIPDQVLSQVRTLKLSSINTFMDMNSRNMKKFFAAFPQLKHLHVSAIYSTDEIIVLLHGFKHLLSASFFSIPYHNLDGISAENYSSNIEFRLEQLRRDNGLNFTYQFVSSRIYIWF